MKLHAPYKFYQKWAIGNELGIFFENYFDNHLPLLGLHRTAGVKLLAARGGSMQLGTHIAYARYVIEHTCL